MGNDLRQKEPDFVPQNPECPMSANSLEPTQMRTARHVVSARQGDRTVLLDMHRGHYYSLDGAGGRIWEMLEKGVELQEVEDQLVREYDAPRERIAGDLRALVGQLRRRGLLS